MLSLYNILNSNQISYKKHDHPAVFTCEEADEKCGDIPGARSKNLFLRNRRGNTHYLLIALQDTKVNLKALAGQVDETQLSFASEKQLLKYLGLTPGSVSPFGLINDENHEVIVLVDSGLLEHEVLAYHPNINTATLEISRDDFKKFLEAMGNEVRYIDVAN
jgi:Ala-tRNA(Pro) deacylase